MSTTSQALPGPCLERAEAAERLLSLVRDGDRIFIGTGAGEPLELLKLVIEYVLPARRDIELLQVSVGGSEVIATVGRERGHKVNLIAPGFAGRAALTDGIARPVAASMGSLAVMLAAGHLSIDGVLVSAVRTPDGSTLSPGLAVDLSLLTARQARFTAVQVNPSLPCTRSVPWLVEENCDLVFEHEESVMSAQPPGISETQRTIGRNVAELVPHGAVLELGVGQALQGVTEALIAREHGFAVSIHTGLITDDIQRLVEAGVVSLRSPCADRACVIATAVRGSGEFYSWVSDNPDVLLVDSTEAHHLGHLAGLEQFVAINSAGAVDIYGNVTARDPEGALGGGGLRDFATAGSVSGGSIIALEARDRHGRSKIVASADHVQLHASAVTHVVTEFGTAALLGKTAAGRVEEMISIAHPDDRASLRAGSTL
ncbi:acetyl-CoA hydrolase/transferase C-terminal domain-containing protein [Rhodococcus opacus]